MKLITATNISTNAIQDIVVVSTTIKVGNEIMTVIHAENLNEEKLNMVNGGAGAQVGCIYFSDQNNDIWKVFLNQI